MTYGFFVYAMVNFAIFFLLMFLNPPGRQVTAAVPPIVWHGFSGHWMAFYSVGLAVLTTAYRRGLSNLQPRCPNGHVIGWDDQFCSTCGMPVDPNGPNE